MGARADDERKLETIYVDEPKEWTLGDVSTAPGADATILTHKVGPGVEGHIFGYLITCQEANNVDIHWKSGGDAKILQSVFPVGGGSLIVITDHSPINQGLPADAESDITVKVGSAAAAGKKYQASLLINRR